MDWRYKNQVLQDRQKNITGNYVTSTGGIFQGLIEASSGENQNARLTYAGGSSSTPLPMPFESTDSWIRSIPLSGSPALLTYRRDTSEVAFVRYLNDEPDKKLALYQAGSNAYRPLLPGEHEIHSSGFAQSYYSQRPVLDQRAGAIRSWLNQDQVESGQKAPIHTRQLHRHKLNSVGDEERFGVVRRPQKLNIANALLLTSTHSSSFYTYPYPDFSLPGGVPAAFSQMSQAIGAATEAIALVTGTYKVRPFAKEYLRIIKNPLNPLPPDVLIDIREGQVFDNDANQVTGSSGAYLRAKREYYTTLSDATIEQIDELGNTNWEYSLGATDGANISIPVGAWKLNTGKGVDISTLTSVRVSSTLGTYISASTDINLDSVLNTAITTGLNYTHTTNGTWESTSKLPMTLKSDMNFLAEAKLILEVKSAVQVNLTAPIVQLNTSTVQIGNAATGISTANAGGMWVTNSSIPIKYTSSSFMVEAGAQASIKAPSILLGSTPTEAMVLGTQLSMWLQNLLTIIISNSASFGISAGSPVALTPQVVSGIQALSAQLPTLTSKTILVST